MAPPRRFLVAPPGKDTVWFTSILVWGSTLNCCNPSTFGSKLVSLSLFGMVFFPENKLQENQCGLLYGCRLMLMLMLKINVSRFEGEGVPKVLILLAS